MIFPDFEVTPGLQGLVTGKKKRAGQIEGNAENWPALLLNSGAGL